jgi:hypothetical protein
VTSLDQGLSSSEERSGKSLGTRLWNNLETNLIISTKLLTTSGTQFVDGLLANLLQDARFLHVYEVGIENIRQ